MAKGFRATGDAALDQILRGVFGLCEVVFPGRVCAAYLVGSHSVGLARPGSDVDICLVFGDRLSEDEETRVRAINLPLWQLSRLGLDLKPYGEGTVRRLQIIESGRLVYGEDVTNHAALSLQERALDPIRLEFYASLRYFPRVRRTSLPLRTPLSWPDPEHRFKGYCGQPTHSAWGTLVPGIRPLLNCTLRPALILASMACGQFRKDKHEAGELFGRHYDRSWCTYLNDLARWGHGTWACQVPEHSEEQTRLEALCERAPVFENAALKFYRDWFLKDLRGDGGKSVVLAREDLPHLLNDPRLLTHPADDPFALPRPHHLLALDAAGRILFGDDEVYQTVDGFCEDKHPLIRAVALRTKTRLRRMHEAGETP